MNFDIIRSQIMVDAATRSKLREALERVSLNDEGYCGRREGTIIEPKELIGILYDILNPSEDKVLA